MFLYLDRRQYNYKYRDDFNRDHVTYELRWSTKDIKRSATEAAAPERKIKFQNIRNKRSKNIEKLKKQISADPKMPVITKIE